MLRNTIKDFIDWKNEIKKNETVESKNKKTIEKLGWSNTDVLYSFLRIYVLGLLAYYPNDFYLSKKKYTVQKYKVKRVYSLRYITNNYVQFGELNNNENLIEFVELYFSEGNIIPIWPGGNENKGKSGIYDLPELYFLKYPQWGNALTSIYKNSFLDCVTNGLILTNKKGQELKINNIKELLSKINNATSDDKKFIYNSYLEIIVANIKFRTRSIKEWLSDDEVIK